MRFAWVLLAIAMPTFCPAGTLQVRTGEHSGFTRLVVDIKPIREWRAGRVAGDYALEIDGATFDIAETFRLIGRERIATLDASKADRLAISLGCECWVKFHEIGDRAIVADVFDGRAPDAARHEAFLEDRPLELEVVRKVAAPDTVAPFPKGAPSIFEGPLVSAGIDPDPRSTSPQFPTAPMGSEVQRASTMRSPMTATDLSMSELGALRFRPEQSGAVGFLSQGLARAAAQGLIRTKPQPRVASKLADLRTSAGNISVSTGLDRALESLPAGPVPTATGAACIRDAALDVAAWGDPSDPFVFGKKHSVLASEDGTLSPDGAVELARFYIALGFGAEAQATLAAVPENESHALLVAMADIVDHGESASPVFESQIACQGRAALWAMLARPISPGDRPVDRTAMLMAFSELPPHLRSFLGPLFVNRLEEAGLPEEAEIALNTTLRSGNETPEQRLAAARMNLDTAIARHARTELYDLTRQTGDVAAEALLTLLLDAEKRNTPPDQDWIEDVPGFVRSFHGTDVAADLNLAGLRGRIALGQFDTLREALSDNLAGLTDSERDALAAWAIGAAASRANTDVFLRTEIALSRMTSPESMKRAERVLTAQRFADFGLYAKGLAYLPSDLQSAEEQETAALLLARTGRADEAVARLPSHIEPIARSILERVISEGRGVAPAVEMLVRSDGEGTMTDLALSLGAWDWVVENAEESVASRVRLLLDPRSLPNSDEPTNGLLIASAEALRREAEALLAEVGGVE